ncbi:GbsR/MarR family transcriptional regulator [Micromonospora sonneratiae]|uniref:GbsR/MarR family transcriptional regulator n=1 Tax=Micromonospora sonneratiae TaxID=1184706 RepID=A0ABW3YG20_9ACTN
MALSDPAERLALALTQGGLQRMTARVLAALLFTDQDTLTAGELADVLGISSGSVSTSVKALTGVGLIEKVPAPGSRREHFRLREHAWATLMSGQNQLVKVMMDAAEEGIAATGPETPGGHRLAEMRDFYAYLWQELPELIDRWKAEQNSSD